VVEEDEHFILQWEQEVQEEFHAGFTLAVSEYVDKQTNHILHE
jgi:hypothetical protein